MQCMHSLSKNVTECFGGFSEIRSERKRRIKVDPLEINFTDDPSSPPEFPGALTSPTLRNFQFPLPSGIDNFWNYTINLHVSKYESLYFELLSCQIWVSTILEKGQEGTSI